MTYISSATSPASQWFSRQSFVIFSRQNGGSTPYYVGGGGGPSGGVAEER